MKALLPPLKPLPIKERLSDIFVERGEIDTLDGAFVVVDATGVEQQRGIEGARVRRSDQLLAHPFGVKWTAPRH